MSQQPDLITRADIERITALAVRNLRMRDAAPELYEALAHILWIKDCGIDSSAGNDSAAERDAMYDIARAALAEVDKP